MQQLHAKYRERGVQFFLVYTREPHPDEEVPQTLSYEERLAYAQVVKEEFKIPYTVLVDAIDDRVQRAYGSVPGPAVVINPEGKVALAQLWCDAAGIDRLLQGALNAQ